MIIMDINWTLTFFCFGAGFFGAVIGWITRYILAFAKEITISSLSTIIAALGGAALTALFDSPTITKSHLFASYSFGLAFGFFGHVLLYDIDPKTGEVVYHFLSKNPVKIEQKDKDQSA